MNRDSLDSDFAQQLHEHQLKSYRYGTQRICAPEETWQRVRPFFPAFGITRIADITWLDKIGIPVFVALRPNSKTLAQSNGKGLNSIQAKVSAVMESIEVWHGEELPRADRIASIEELNREALLTYDPYSLPLMADTFLCDSMPIEWMACQDLTNSCSTYLPREPLDLDWTVKQGSCLPCFISDTNGLASGNSILEATLHGLCEVIERDARVQYQRHISKGNPGRLVALETIDSPICLELIEQCKRAKFKIYIEDVSSEFGLAAFQVSITTGDHFGISQGYGCHPSRETALLRALTETAQTRVTFISAARDDLHTMLYHMPKNPAAQARLAQQLTEGRDLSDYKAAPDFDNDYLEEDLDQIVTTLKESIGAPVLVADLSKPEYAIPVVKVVVPKLQEPAHRLGTMRSDRSASGVTAMEGQNRERNNEA